MNIVLDTNVLVSGLLTPFGPSGKIVRLIFSGDLMVWVDARILSEYREVLNRPKFKFDKEKIEILLDFLEQNGSLFSSRPLSNSLPDPDDEPFLEVAIAAEAQALITGNKVHYPESLLEGIVVVSPSEFIEIYRKIGLRE